MGDTIQDSIDHVRASADVLSDPDDLDNLAIMGWMRHHAAFRRHHHSYVIGTDTLPPLWRREVVNFTGLQDALALLRPLKTDHLAMAGLRRALNAVARQVKPTDDAVISGLADALVSHKAWLIRDAKKPVTIVKTDPAVYAKLNAEGGTNVDFAYLSRWEGNQFLRGYVPFSKGITAGVSGMTVATGFDLGQINQGQYDKLNLPPTILPKVQPFLHPAGEKRSGEQRFKGKTRAQVAAVVAKLKPVPLLTKDEADAADLAVHGKHLRSAVASWNTRHAKGVPDFRDLPGNWQTVLFSRTFHQGTGMPDTAVAKPFYTAAIAGKWAQAADALQNYAVPQAWYKTRVGQEAALLRTQLPPPVVPPKVPGKP